MPAPPDFCRFFATVPDTHFGEDRHRVHGHRGVSEWTYTGTTATGQHIHARGCDLFTFRDGNICHKDSFLKQVRSRPASVALRRPYGSAADMESGHAAPMRL
jgi:ketosteroid isomerase-like protein